jgi:hypothetical protein
LRDVKEGLGRISPVGRVVDVLRLSSLDPELLFPPLSLPLSTACLAVSSILCNNGSSVGPFLAVSVIGVEGTLASWTVSKVVPVPPVFLVETRREPPSPSLELMLVGDKVSSSDGGVKDILFVEILARVS